MSWRRELEDKYTVACRVCRHEIIDPTRKPNQKYIKGVCPACGDNDKCDIATGIHAPDCDGFCDHFSDHSNGCMEKTS